LLNFYAMARSFYAFIPSKNTLLCISPSLCLGEMQVIPMHHQNPSFPSAVFG
jgi:hypothetical protein